MLLADVGGDAGRLRRVTKGWWGVAYVKKRQALIRAAIAAYKDRKHSLTVSALLPLVEGLAAAYFRKNPNLVVRRPGRQATVLVKDAALLHREVRADHSDLLMAALQEQIYARYSFDAGRAPSALNRHGILHGEIARFGTALLHGPEQIADLPVPVAESPGAVRIGHPERSHLVEYLAPNSVFNSLPRQRSSPHLRPDDRLVTIDRVLHHASLGVA